MALVYLAEDVKLHRPVAIRVLRPEIAASVGSDRFLREIEIAARLQYPGILPLFDSGGSDGFLFYVIPYVPGESLRERLKRDGRLSLDESFRIAREVAEALGYAHAQGVLHRDIKPENILLEGGHAVVADFGIARAVGQAGDERLTASGHAVGTPAYMSPEQAAGVKELDGRAEPRCTRRLWQDTWRWRVATHPRRSLDSTRCNRARGTSDCCGNSTSRWLSRSRCSPSCYWSRVNMGEPSMSPVSSTIGSRSCCYRTWPRASRFV
jgi:serine/threonine protein kinase